MPFLAEEEPAAIADMILCSMNAPDPDGRRQWADERQQRLTEVRSDQVTAILGEEVFARVWCRLESQDMAWSTNMKNSKSDSKNVALARLVKQLRDNIDLYRLIGLNSVALQKSKISNALLAHIQSLAHGSIAVLVCKIYEDSKRNELDSIPAIIESLPAVRLTGEQQDEVIRFGTRYGNSAKLTDAKSYLRGTLGLFMGIHSMAFEKMKRYRDKVGAHGESKAKITSLPSHDEFEAFFSFAEDFYRVVSGAFIDVGPANTERRVGKGLLRLMQSMGIDEPIFDFKE